MPDDEAEAQDLAARLKPALALLSQDFTTPVRVADLARAVDMSPSRFAHIFKETTGTSPHRFRQRLRLDHARYLLKEKGLSVSTVAFEVGYRNVSHFIEEFKRVFGTTPGTY